jgi:RNA polymerase sigma-70 factor (ECF subfamily)
MDAVAQEDGLAELSRAREGDLEAYAEFVRLFERRVRALLSRLLDDARDVEEAAQDTFVQAWRNLGRFRGDSAPFTWLYRIAVNEALQRLRRKRLDSRPLDDLDTETLPHPAAGPDALAESHEARAFLEARVRALPIELRAPLVLRDVEGLPNEEVAVAIGLSVAATKSRIHRARMRIRAEFQAWLDEASP